MLILLVRIYKIKKGYKMAYTRFIDKLYAKRMARKSSSGLWIKISKFTEDRTIQIIRRRINARKFNNFLFH